MHTPATPASRFGLIAFAVIASALTLLGSVVYFTAKRNPPDTTAVAPIVRSVAVLPFIDLTPDRAAAAIGDGIADSVINTLTKEPGLTVAPRDSSFPYRSKTGGAKAVGEGLGMATVLTGSVKRDGAQFLIAAELVTAATGRVLWSETFTRSADSVVSVSLEIANGVANAMRPPNSPRIDSITR